VEVAAASVLLAMTVLTVLTLRRLEAEGPGIRVDGLLHARLSLPASRYPSQGAVEAYVARLRASLRAEIGVTGADVATALPLSGQNARTDFVVLGREPRTAAEMPGAQLRFVSAGYVETVGLPLRRGRGFREEDETGRAAVALVDEALARQLWPDRDPVGDSLRIEGPSKPVFRVVGVVGSVKHFGLDEAPLGTLYLPVHTLPPQLRGFFVGNHTLAVGGNLLGAEARRRVAAAVQRVDPEVSASALTSMRETLAGAQSTRAFAAWLGALFAAAALLLAVSGLYAVAAARAQDQLRELAVRLALGASPASVGLRLLAVAVRPLVLGLAIGVPLAWAAVGALGPDVVPEVRARPEGWALAPAVLLLAGFLAVLPPAWRAARLDVARLLGEG
jgi:putative ABC transport system permease protein